MRGFFWGRTGWFRGAFGAGVSGGRCLGWFFSGLCVAWAFERGGSNG